MHARPLRPCDTGSLGVEEVCAYVFACSLEDDQRTRQLLGSTARAGRGQVPVIAST